MRLVEKPWGSELWIAHSDTYALKKIRIKKGTRTSLQYHEKKREHIYVESGRVLVTLEAENGELVLVEIGAGEVLENEPLAKHRLEALEDTCLFEVSTPELEDVVRIEDDFDRD